MAVFVTVRRLISS